MWPQVPSFGLYFGTVTPIPLVMTAVLFDSEQLIWFAGMRADALYNLCLYKPHRL